jgi:hypothetical protein
LAVSGAIYNGIILIGSFSAKLAEATFTKTSWQPDPTKKFAPYLGFSDVTVADPNMLFL